MPTLTHAPRRFYFFILLLTLSLVGRSGCAKQRASMALKSTKKRLVIIKSYEVERFDPDKLKTLEDTIVQAEIQLELDPASALMQANSAKEQSRTLLETTRQAYALALKVEAKTHIGVARDNHGDQEDRALFSKIGEDDLKANEYMDKLKYEKAIPLFRAVAEQVTSLLQNLREESVKNLMTVENELDALITNEYGREKANIQVMAIEEKIVELKDFISPEQRQYVVGKAVFLEIQTQIKEAVILARKVRSDELIRVLENKLTTAIFEEADTYLPDVLAKSQAQFRDILVNFNNLEYLQVLSEGGRLESSVDELILESRIRAAKAALAKVTAAIFKLDTDKIRNYLPNRLEQVEAELAKAQQQFDIEQYNKCKDICKSAMEIHDVLAKDFNTYAVREISAASEKFDQAATFLERMDSIFESQETSAATPKEKAFEASKKGLRDQLNEIAAGAEILLSKANVQREQGEYSSSIEDARLVGRKSDRVSHDIYHVVAHNNIQVISTEVSETVRQGASEFAPEELKSMNAVLAKARLMIREVEEKEAQQAKDTGMEIADLQVPPNAFRPAVSVTSEANAELETVYQRLRAEVSAKIDKSRQALQLADENRAGTRELGSITSARQLSQNADALLAQKQYYDAASNADQSRQIALDAGVKSIKAWASQELEAADAEIEKTKRAELDPDQALRFRETQLMRTSAEEVFSGTDSTTDAVEASNTFRESRDLAIAARKSAIGVRNASVNDAQRAITTAKQFNAWEYDYPMLVDSIILVKEAMEAMEAGDYALGKRFATKATALARRATVSSKAQTHSKRINQANIDIQSALNEGAVYFSRDELLDLIRRLQAIKNNYTVEDHETFSAELDQFDNDLSKLAGAMPAQIQSLIDGKRKVYTTLGAMQAKDFATQDMADADRYLRFAQIDFDKSDPRSSHRNLLKATQSLSAVELQMAEMDFARDTRKLLSKFDSNLDLIRPIMKASKVELRMVFDDSESKRLSRALFLGSDPRLFRERMDNLLKEGKEVPYPETLTDQRNELISMLDHGRQSSEKFEKFLILHLYDKKTAASIIEDAYKLMNQTELMKEALSKEFEIKGLQTPLLKPKEITQH